ncbi:DUF922 domain-containing protein [Mesorhizobium sp. NBSH29]|nr:DUF922 domain-containing protein [Mesorhizobium sp. NBSH29]
MTTAALCAFQAPANAGVKVTIKQASYEISGKSGATLLDAMDRSGPKHGFLTRAIAQTRYTVGWNIVWAQNGKQCRVKKADALLSITYTFPQLKDRLAPDMQRRWTGFIKGVTRHEETHGRIARQMVTAADRVVSATRMAHDPGCRQSQALVKKKVATIYAEYEKRQVLFDKKEHSSHGNVESLVLALKK